MKVVELPNGKKFNYYTPKELKAHLDEYIVGQDEAKTTLSVAIYNHYKRLLLTMNNKNIRYEKSNVLMLGPSGSGKTAMIKCIAEYMGVPYYIADATTLTQAGYVGDDVESILVGLVKASNYSLAAAEYGIIFIDEIDKIAKKGSNVHISRDVVGEGVQQALLKMVEGDVVGIPPAEGRKHPEQQLIYINTKNILFVASGAFPGIEDIIKERLNMRQIGYVQDTKATKDFDENKVYEYMCQDDLRKFGMIPEFIGRFPVLTTVNKLTQEQLVKILKEPKNSILNQYDDFFKYDKITIKYDDDALEFIASLALELETGARGLRSIMENILNKCVFDFCGGEKPKTIRITKNYVIDNLGKRYSMYASKVA